MVFHPNNFLVGFRQMNNCFLATQINSPSLFLVLCIQRQNQLSKMFLLARKTNFSPVVIRLSQLK